MAKFFIINLMAVIFFTGCVRMYAPISWEYRERAMQIVDKDPLLSALYKRFDPKKLTLRGPNGYDEIAYHPDVTSHLAAYNAATKVIYVNREINYNDNQLKEVLIHEICHYIWDTGLDEIKRKEWSDYLKQHPSPLQRLVTLFYPASNLDIEKFAFTIEFPQKDDIKELVKLSILTEPEASAVLNKMISEPKYEYWGVGMFDNVDGGKSTNK